MTDSSVVAQAYDAVYEAMPRSQTLLRIWKQNAAGHDYPDEFSHISFLTFEELSRIPGVLALSRDAAFADIACGMGGPGLWIARDTQARLHGVDFSSVAVRRAAERADALGMGSRAEFSLGSFAETGLKTGSMDGAMTIDALQYAPDKRAAMREFARIIRPSGRLAFCAFELHPDRVDDLPVIGEDPIADYRPLMEEAGFQILVYDETPHWRDRVLAAFGAVINEQQALRAEMGEIATAAMLSEITVTLERDIYSGRPFVVGERK